MYLCGKIKQQKLTTMAKGGGSTRTSTSSTPKGATGESATKASLHSENIKIEALYRKYVKAESDYREFNKQLNDIEDKLKGLRSKYGQIDETKAGAADKLMNEETKLMEQMREVVSKGREVVRKGNAAWEAFKTRGDKQEAYLEEEIKKTYKTKDKARREMLQEQLYNLLNIGRKRR